jgi:hypothetical protein
VEHILRLHEQDLNFKLLDKVIARWTNCDRYFSAKATIVKLNAKSILVKLGQLPTAKAIWLEQVLMPTVSIRTKQLTRLRN